jgi:hypothetical protein
MTGQDSETAAKGAPLTTLQSRTQLGAFGMIEIIALALSALWLLGALGVYLFAPEDHPSSQSLEQLMALLAVAMPLALIWVAATAARAGKAMREESQQMQAAIDGLRAAYLSQQQKASAGAEPSVVRKLDEIAAAAKKTESALATFQAIRQETARSVLADPPQDLPAPVAAPGQGSLELGPPGINETAPLEISAFIRALNFPETAEDQEGFAALRMALQNRKSAQVVQAAQDVLTLLSQEGIYMDDLRPDMARPEVWREFAQGVRGRAVAALGGVRDRSSLALTSARMKQDPIFRDAAHHFLRRFDQMFAEFEREASDSDISALSDTRTARAFMLLGRVAGTFD